MFKVRGDGVMVFRAIVCCAALVFGLLAALSATAQSASAPQPLNLMSFMHASGKAGPAGTDPAKTASPVKHRRATGRTAGRPSRDIGAAPAASSELPVVPVAAYASQSTDDVQVVSSEEINAIDLAMNSAVPETNGAAPRTGSDNRNSVKWVDANEFRAEQYKPASETAGTGAPRDDSWMGRFWSAIGDGFVALVAMVKQLFS